MAKSSFFSDISDWVKEAEQQMATEAAQVARTVFTMIVDRSPYSTGKFIANWHVGPTDVNYSTMATMDWDNKIAEINKTITADYFLRHDRVYLVNNVDYSDKVEYLGWVKTSAYAPVAKTINKIGNGFAPIGQTLGAIAGGIV